jgi:hypothetical protein
MSAERNGNDIELLSAYLDGQLTEAERSALEARLQQDADLRRQLAQLRATVDLLRALPELSAPRDFSLNHMQVYGQQRARRTPYVFSLVSAAAAVVLLLAGVFLTLMTSRIPQDEALVGSISEATQQESIALLATDVGPVSPVPTAALADTSPPVDDQAEARQAAPAAGADQQNQQPEISMQFAPATGTLLPLAQPAPPQEGAASADTASTAIEEFGAEQITPEFETFAEAPGAAGEADLADEEEAPAAGLLLAQPTQQATQTPAPTLPPPTATRTLTSTPSLTPIPSATTIPAPTLAPPAPASAVQPQDTGAIGLVLIVGAVVLLAISLFAFLLSRRG